MGQILGVAIFGLVVSVFKIICLGLVFRKAGEGIWKAFVPIYSEYILGKIAGHAVLGLSLAIISIFTIFASFYTTYNSYQMYMARVEAARQEATSGVVYTTDANGNYKAISVPKKPSFANDNKANMARNEIASTQGLSILLSIASFVITVIIYYGLCNNFGKSMGFLIGLILLNNIFIAILAFDDSEYRSYYNRY